MTYSISAEVYSKAPGGAEKRTHLNTTRFPVLTHGYSNAVNVIVEEITTLESETSLSKDVITGSIDFAQSNDLALVTKIIIKLKDVSLADAPSIEISHVTLTDVKKTPVEFTLNYPSDEIKEGMTYSIAAEVYSKTSDGTEKRTHLNTTRFPVLTHGYGNTVNVIVEEIAAPEDDASLNKDAITGNIDFAQSNDLALVTKIIIKLKDVSLADAPSIEISQVTLTDVKKIPVEFTLNYPSDEIKEGMTYSISAEVYSKTSDGTEKRTHLNTTRFPVLTLGYGNTVNVTVEEI